VENSFHFKEDKLKLTNDFYELEEGQDETERPYLTIKEVLHAQCLEKNPNYYVAFVKVNEFEHTLLVHCDIDKMNSPKKLVILKKE